MTAAPRLRGAPWRLAFGLSWCLASVLPAEPAWCQAAGAASTLAAVGNTLYDTGELAGQLPLSARSGNDGAWVLRGRAIACANCHGVDAEGGGEGYARAPPLRWPEWASADASVRAAARVRLERALQRGQAQDGRPLSAAMPRFDVDDRTVDALAAHLAAIVSRAPVARVPTFALLHRVDAQAPPIEQALHRELEVCLRQGFGDRVRVERREAASAAQAQAIWADWASRGEVVAVLAPPWRQGSLQAGAAGVAPAGGLSLPVLFPLASDPEPGVPATSWLYGGVHARSVALVQAGWAGRPPGEPMAVWPGTGAEAEQRWAALDSVAEAVFRGTGRRPLWLRLTTPVGRADRPALWLDPDLAPTPGWWLAPVASTSRPAARVRLWAAQPYAGRTLRPLAQRWADATCRTIDALLAVDPALTRSRWAAALSSLGRLNDGNGWDWRPAAADPQGHGAADGWTIVEFAEGELRLVELRVDIARTASNGP